MNKQIYKLCLDDYSAASFTSFGKEYFGTFEMIESFIDAIKYDEQISEKFADLISTFDNYKNGAKNVTHNVAYKEVPFLKRVKCLGKTNSLLMNYKWEHLNTWRWPYNMMFEISQSEHLWLSFNKRYVRCIKTVFTNLQYQNCTGEYTTPGMLWGFPHQIEIEKSKVFNRLFVVEKCFKNKQEAVKDMNGFSIKPDPVYNEIINDIFGDG